jgi:hypothetical protein
MRREIHTESSLEELRMRRIKLQETLLSNVHLRSVMGWKIPKFFTLAKFERVARLIASAPFTDTGYHRLPRERVPFRETFSATHQQSSIPATSTGSGAQQKG